MLRSIPNVEIHAGSNDSIDAKVGSLGASLVYRGKKEVAGVRGPAWELSLLVESKLLFAAILVGKRHALESAKAWLEGMPLGVVSEAVRSVTWRVTKEPEERP